MKIINPATQEVIKEVEADNKETLDKKLDLLKQGTKEWGQLGINKRIEIIKNFVSELEKNKEGLSFVLTRETGKPLQESHNEVNGAIYRTQYFIDNADHWLSKKIVHTEGNTQEFLSFDPLGVVANISAWNYPFLVGVNVFVPALLAGNTVFYKPSEYATLTGLNIEKALRDAGVPENAFQCAIGDKEVGEVLLDYPLDGYFFTGSYKTGQYIAKRVADKLVPVGLELGGKDPLYITDDVLSVEQAAASALEGAFYNNGQSCCAVERIYVHEKIYDAFTREFVAQAEDLEIGDPFDPEINQGPITRGQHLDFLEAQVKDATSKGATLLIGGQRLEDEEGNYFPPTVLVGVDHTMDIMKEETFGPVIGIQKVTSDNNAIELMQDTQYGLTAGVFCQDQERATKILDQIDSGNSYINCCDRVSPYLPWSGRKNSGLGSTLSYLGILAFAKPRGHHVRTLK